MLEMGQNHIKTDAQILTRDHNLGCEVLPLLRVLKALGKEKLIKLRYLLVKVKKKKRGHINI